jgi:acid phosphatase
VLDDAEYDPGTWDQWVAMKAAPAVPGAVEFINSMAEKGIEVIFITNRECKPRPGSDEPCPQEQNTIDNLRNVGIHVIKPDNLLLKNEKPEWSSEKKSRREAVATNYRVVMLFGDDLGDFLPNVKKNITSGERSELVRKYGSHWGTKWFMLTNPMYGSWLRVLDDPKSNHLRVY